MDAPACPVCGRHDTFSFFEMQNVPVHIGIQWPTADAARACPRGDIALHFCEHCEHIFNARFDPALVEYNEAYDNALDYSPRFRHYLHTLAEDLIARHNLHDKKIVEIGCGKGHFLTLLAESGHNRAIGFDPSYEPGGAGVAVAEAVTFVQDYYTGQHGSHDADFVCCRHVLEHVDDPVDFLRMVRHAQDVTTHPVLYFEVPNAGFILRDYSIWDIIYEHYSIFTLRSLAYAFQHAGFAVADVYEGYDGQFISIEAHISPNGSSPNGAPSNGHTRKGHPSRGDSASRPTDAVPSAAPLVPRFRNEVGRRIAHWQHYLGEIQRTGSRAVLWGAGSKAVGFMNLLAAEQPTDIAYVVDINPNKHGAFLPGTGQQIVPPEFLTSYDPDVVIVMNPIYQDEIQAMLADLGVSADLFCAS